MTFQDPSVSEFFSRSKNGIALSSIDSERLPSHVSFIMDGNGRWAQRQGLDRAFGHKAGVDALRETVTACVKLGIPFMSAYAFSTENWNRPLVEVNLLMSLFARTLERELVLFDQENVRLCFLGDIEALPKKVYSVFKKGLEQTQNNTGMVLSLAVNYGSRRELARATKHIAKDVLEGSLSLDAIDENLLSQYLYTASLPDPDLLIRTSGEFRLSNFLLYQLAYTEIYISDCLWPDFDRFELLRAIQAFQSRDRRFGGVKHND